ncbi:phytanoyl-CoA dioxygenase family protein [Massilia yuzhufengensis]|uniref:Phytanoyl-CoA dioxygenase (PhyH) n=1 Tax=Massilia yuzhufengensis TaxID=1164594 RepID=A0A1I1S359_9BURK|nr:phytanoyl-CoA dioxygenase family protein [Massilia yuzhufengensis]SFD40782.1 Phytanoyl-CoA dioxygenase (PhyH) [Massilia yuzhufengensis]
MTIMHQELVDRLDSDTFDPDVFRAAGVFVVRNAVSLEVMRAWQDEWAAFYASSLREGRDVNRANPVSLTESLPEKLAAMVHEPAFARILTQVFGPHVAVYNHRFVIKDQFSPGKVFLHQDSCYHLGNLNKCSIFTPLSVVDAANGAMSFHVGSHKLGVLGDAGEINPAAFDFSWPKITPELNPGDLVIMNSSLWHESGPNTSGVHRILADTIFQPADDPTGKELVCGEWQTDIFYSTQNHIRLFTNSRILKLIKYEKERAASDTKATS